MGVPTVFYLLLGDGDRKNGVCLDKECITFFVFVFLVCGLACDKT